MISTGIPALFWIAAFYDGVLGAIFLAIPAVLFRWFDVTPPNHYGYVRFPALLLIVFAILFASVANSPVRNRNLIPYGILLKASYCGVVFGYWLLKGVPNMWKPFAVADLIFGVLFYIAYRRLAMTPEGAKTS